MRLSREQLVRRQQHAGVQNPHCSAFSDAEGLLQVGDRAALGEAFDRLHAAAVRLGGEHQTAAHRRAVHAHGARAADAVLAADVRAREPQLVAEEVDEVLARLDLSRHRRAVDGQRDLHEPPSTSRLTTRESSTRARCRRRAGEPWMSPGGSRSPSSARPRRGEGVGVRAPADQREPRRPGRGRASCRHRRTRAAPRPPPRARGARPRRGPRARSRRAGAPAPRTPSAIRPPRAAPRSSVTISPGSSAVV